MGERNAYEVLGVEPGAAQIEIQAAYRARSLLFHPDRLAGMPDAAREVALVEMQALNEAYGVLKDPGRRAALDRELGALTAKAETSIHTPNPEEDTVPSSAQPAQPSRQTQQGDPVRVRVTVDRTPPEHTVPWPAIFPPAGAAPSDAPRPGQARALPRRGRRQVDLARFFLFGAITSLGWVAVLLADVAFGGVFAAMLALAFSAALAAAIPLIKPPAARRPKSAGALGWRGLLLGLAVVAAFAIMLFPRLGAAMIGDWSSVLRALTLLVAVAFTLIVHWGLCVVGYLLT